MKRLLMCLNEFTCILLLLSMFISSAEARSVYVHRLDPSKELSAALAQLPVDDRFVTPEDVNTPYRFATAFRVGFDDECLYLVVDMVEPEIDRLTFGSSDYKGWPTNDNCEIFIDVGQTRRGYVQLAFSCDGTRYDSRMRKKDWTAAWTALIEHDADAWHAFVRIPFSDLGAATPPIGTVWGFNICRNRQVTGTRESATWAHVGSAFHKPGKFGKLIFGSPEHATAERTLNIQQAFAALRERQPPLVPDDYKRRLDTFAEALDSPAGNLDGLSRQLTGLKDELQVILALKLFQKENEKNE